MAMVPLLVMRMKVINAIRINGMCLPPIVKANTSLELGQGTGVDIRTVMYEIKKILKIKVSLTKKIHIMVLPHGTFLNDCWSDDQSLTKPFIPGSKMGE
jgi:hypothetical protein